MRRRGGNRSPRYCYGPAPQTTGASVIMAELGQPESALLTKGDQPNDMEVRLTAMGNNALAQIERPRVG